MARDSEARICMRAVTAQPPAPAWIERLWRMAVQVLIIVGLEKVYEATRGLVPRQQDVALQHAETVIDLEKSWHIFDEWWVQSFVFRHAQWHFGPFTLDQHTLIAVINQFYLYSHFLGTLGFLIWLSLWRPVQFRLVRDIIFITTALALVIYIAFPMMPPRLLGVHSGLPHHYQFKDTLAPILNYKLQQAQIGYNPYAAMPSLHFAWALILGGTLVLVGRHPLLRLFGLLYPLMMLATIVISGNHLWLDAAGSVIVDMVATALAVMWHRRLARRPRLQIMTRLRRAA